MTYARVHRDQHCSLLFTSKFLITSSWKSSATWSKIPLSVWQITDVTVMWIDLTSYIYSSPSQDPCFVSFLFWKLWKLLLLWGKEVRIAFAFVARQRQPSCGVSHARCLCKPWITFVETVTTDRASKYSSEMGEIQWVIAGQHSASDSRECFIRKWAQKWAKKCESFFLFFFPFFFFFFKEKKCESKLQRKMQKMPRISRLNFF